MKTCTQILWTFLLAFVLQACGGGSGSGGDSQLTGQFVDDPVEGLTYQCVTPGGSGTPVSGVTNGQGQFKYQAGQTCTFSVGRVVVGSLTGIPADGVVTPHDVAGVVRGATSDPTVTVIAQFLQSLSEPGSSGKIKISSDTTAKLTTGAAVQLVSTTDPVGQDKLTALVTTAGKALVPATQAAATLSTQMSKAGVSLTAGAVNSGSAAVLKSVTVSAPNASIAAGAVLKLTATSNMSDGTSSTTDGTVTWSSSDTTLATVASDGTVTSLKPGMVKLTASRGNFSGSMEITVTDAVLQSLSVPSGLNADLPLGLTRALSLVGTYSDGTQKTLGSGVNWTSSDASKISVNDQGVVTAKGTGTVDVTGTMGAVSKKITLTATPAVLKTIQISRADGDTTAVAAGRTVKLTATGTYSDGSTPDVTSAVTWVSGNDHLAVSSGGLVTTITAGAGSLHAKDVKAGVEAAFDLTVGPAVLESVSIDQGATSLAEGLNQTLTLRGIYSDKSLGTSLTGVAWNTEDASKVTVATNGQITALAVGTSKVTATVGGVSTSVVVTVTEPVAKSLTVSSGLSSIVKGASTIINAVATLTNNAVVAVAKAVNWTVDTLGVQAVFTINGDTVTLTGTVAGDIKIKGEYQGVFSNLTVTVTPPVLSGVVAVGAPLPSVNVTVTDAKGVEVKAETAADGSYQVFDPADAPLVAPFKVKVKSLLGTAEVSLNSFALERGNTSNVTPLSTAVMALMNAANGYNASSLDVTDITKTKATDVTSKLSSALAPVMAAANVSAADFNPVSGTFVANNQGIDSVMDRIALDTSNAGISITNRFALLKEGDASPAPVVVSSTGSTGTLPVGITPPSADTLAKFAAQLKKCFAVDASDRVKYTVNTAGKSLYTPSTLHADCSAMVDMAYRSQGQTFGQRWLYFLSSTDFDSTTQFVIVPQYVVDRSDAVPAWPGDKKAYVYNINLIDKNKLTYTMPDVLAKVNDEFVIRGNQRKFDLSIQPMFSKSSDNAGSSNSIEGRIRIGIDPTLVPNGNGVGTYNYTLDGTKPLPKILCAWVTGPLLQNDEKHDVNHPVGGVLMVPPHSDYTARRDYSAVRIKYPMGFDPISNATDRERLQLDCKQIQIVGNNVEVGSSETNNAFTIDAVKTNASSTASFAAYTPLNAPVAYPTSLNRRSCPAFNGSTQTNINMTGGVATTALTVSGWCYSTKRESMVSPALRSAFETLYKDPKDLQFTFYVFVDQNYIDRDTQNVSKADVAYTNYTTPESFLASAEKVNVRTVGKLPFLDKATVTGTVIYAGTEQFRGVGQAMIETYLKAGAQTLAKNTTVNASWTIPIGAEGIDRLGISGWFRKQDGSRIGAATFADSFGLPRSKTAAVFSLSEDWYGFDRQTYQNGMFTLNPYSAASSYREIWVRSYDRYNRQIQTVEFANR